MSIFSSLLILFLNRDDRISDLGKKGSTRPRRSPEHGNKDWEVLQSMVLFSLHYGDCVLIINVTLLVYVPFPEPHNIAGHVVVAIVDNRSRDVGIVISAGLYSRRCHEWVQLSGRYLPSFFYVRMAPSAIWNPCFSLPFWIWGRWWSIHIGIWGLYFKQLPTGTNLPWRLCHLPISLSGKLIYIATGTLLVPEVLMFWDWDPGGRIDVETRNVGCKLFVTARDPRITWHSFVIGSTTKLLQVVACILPDFVKTIGRRSLRIPFREFAWLTCPKPRLELSGRLANAHRVTRSGS